MKLRLFLWAAIMCISAIDVLAQIDSYIQFDPTKHIQKKVKLDLSLDQSKTKPVKYFILTDHLTDYHSLSQTKIPIGFAAKELKKHLIPDLEIERLFRKFRIYYGAPYVGIPLGISIYAVGSVLFSNDTFNIASRAGGLFVYYFLGGSIGTMLYSFKMRINSWNVLKQAVDRHNSLLLGENEALNRLKLNPTLINSGLGIKPVLGLNLSFSLN